MYRSATIVLASASLAAPTFADTIYIGPGDSIQAAIDSAFDGDVLVVGPGVYDEAIDFDGKAITLRSSDGFEHTTIDATGLGKSVVTCLSAEGPDTVLDGFTIKGGEGTWTIIKTRGGGMYNKGSSPTIRNCTFVGNTAYEGAGMCNVFANPTIEHCRFLQNWVPNVETESGGGAMYNKAADAMITNCLFAGNTAPLAGGAIYNKGADVVLINCAFQGNSTDSAGGAIYSNYSDMTVVNCVFAGNSAVAAAGLRVTGGDLTMSNSILWGNVPDQISVGSADVSVSNSNIEGGWDGPGNMDQDPRFVATDNLRLEPDSPCIDAGVCGALLIQAGGDLTGNDRFMGIAVDLGPYEREGVGVEEDCNENGFPDECDIAAGASIDENGDGLPDECEVDKTFLCPGDLNGDLIVDVADLVAVMLDFDCNSNCSSDIDGNGIVDILDVIMVFDAWGICNP